MSDTFRRRRSLDHLAPVKSTDALAPTPHSYPHRPPSQVFTKGSTGSVVTRVSSTSSQVASTRVSRSSQEAAAGAVSEQYRVVGLTDTTRARCSKPQLPLYTSPSKLIRPSSFPDFMDLDINSSTQSASPWLYGSEKRQPTNHRSKNNTSLASTTTNNSSSHSSTRKQQLLQDSTTLQDYSKLMRELLDGTSRKK
jgi:hypothetical protein